MSKEAVWEPKLGSKAWHTARELAELDNHIASEIAEGDETLAAMKEKAAGLEVQLSVAEKISVQRKEARAKRRNK